MHLVFKTNAGACLGFCIPEDALDLSGEVAAMFPPLEALCMIAIEPGIRAGPVLSPPPRERMVGPRPPPSSPPVLPA